ncbi:MAG: 3-deoxy-D-manno-octulosonic acid transferase [Deltaproteobacteria bacterium]|nr:3-deoxy-D-manno-octulosonic acid transferase [Deltaproteobacteria bacterium]
MTTCALSRVAYDCAGVVASAAVVPALPVIALTRYGHGLSERLGVLSPAVRALAGQGVVWLHAASVGEVLAAGPLIEALHRQRRAAIVMSTTSLTGRERARALPGVAAVMLLPVDLRWVVARVMRLLAPRALVIMETEIWPALLHAAADYGVPAVVVSGRVSERAAARYAWVRPIVRASLRRVAAFAMQTEADAARIIALGAPSERVRVVGSLKYARGVPAAVPDGLRQLDGLARRPVLIAASTQPGEEQFVLNACGAVWAAHPDCLLVLAPRRPERFDEVEQLLVQAGVRHQRRSRLGRCVQPQTQVLLIDSVGELPGLLSLASSVFVGGTVAPLGGHNVLEPAAAGVAVCFGPHTENVAEAAAALLCRGGGTLTREARELGAAWVRALAEPEAARARGRQALAVVQARSAVVAETLALVEAVLR